MDEIAGKKIDNRRIVEAIQALRTEGTQETSRRLTAALIHEDTLFLLPMAPEGKGILTLNTPDGKRFLPAFSSVAELKKTSGLSQKQRLALLDVTGYAKLLEQHKEFSGAVIDPQGMNFPLSLELLQKLSQRKEELAKRPKGPVTILSPKDGFSNDMTKAVGKALYKVPEVDSCFLRIVQRGEGENAQRNWLFVVEYYGEDFNSVVRLICETCKPFLPADAQVDAALYSSELGQRVTEKGEPFFRRQMLWV